MMENKIKWNNIDFRIDLLEDTIRSRQLHMLSNCKSVMLELFWEIGKILNNTVDEHRGDLIEELGGKLAQKHGSYLSAFNLKQMREFAIACPAETLRLVSLAVGWNHIPVLNKLTISSDWTYYANLVYEEQLTPAALAEKIIKEKPETLEKIDPPFPRFDKALVEGHMNILEFDRFFRNDKHNDFRKLFELKPIADTVSAIDQTTHMIDLKIDYFRKLYNNLLYHQGYASFESICEQIDSAYEALRENSSLQTILDLVAARFDGNLSAQWLEGWFKTYKELNGHPSRPHGTLFLPSVIVESKEQVTKKGNVTTTVTMSGFKEDLDTGYNIYENPDIMYFLEQA